MTKIEILLLQNDHPLNERAPVVVIFQYLKCHVLIPRPTKNEKDIIIKAYYLTPPSVGQ